MEVGGGAEALIPASDPTLPGLRSPGCEITVNEMSPPRFIIYSHDHAVGSDHLRRSLAIAAAVTEVAPEASVLLVTGDVEPLSDALAANVDVLTLPGVRSLGNGGYSARRLAMSGVELWAMRAAQIEAAVSSFRPHAMLVDTNPLGLRGELRPALESLRSAGGRAALGIGDVLDDPAMAIEEWPTLALDETAEPLFERVLVYGDRRVLDCVEERWLPERVAARARYVGYVVWSGVRRGGADLPPALASRPSERPLVLATAEGHEDGAHLLATFVQAAHGAAWDGVVAAGRRLSEAHRHALRRDAVEAGVNFYVAAGDISTWFARADALVCMGGYSAVAEAIACGTPTLCVPSVSGTREQLIRARALGRLGLMEVIEPASLDPALLRTRVSELLGAGPSRPGPWAPRLDGAARTAHELLELAAR
jgi:predicted glycosyltransferase